MIEGVVNAAYEPVVVLSDAAETTPLVANLLCVKSCFRLSSGPKRTGIPVERQGMSLPQVVLSGK